ncbi:MAG: hypothetical protein IPF99_35450 [Deltaproteobacteria bacterium]|nr:hypothetical protein [Deltaproteobacteria bacterium]
MNGNGKVLLEFTDFNLSLLGVGFVDIWVAQNISLMPFTSGRIAVSFRNVNIANAGSSVRFDLIPVVLRWDDPGKFYRDTNKPLPSTGPRAERRHQLDRCAEEPGTRTDER